MKQTEQEKLNEIEDLDYTIDFLNDRISFLDMLCKEKEHEFSQLCNLYTNKNIEIRNLEQQLNRVPKIIKWLFRIK